MASPMVVLGGVSGSGKSVVGPMLARRLGGDFFDGDDFHPPANKEKMKRKEPLTDADRWPWLASLVELMKSRQGGTRATVVGCSALRPEYRQMLAFDPNVRIAMLIASREELMRRLGARTDHFFPAELLDSQLATLVPPAPGESAFSVNAQQSPEAIVEEIALRVSNEASGTFSVTISPS